MDVTLLYYSASREAMERWVIGNIKEHCEIPIVSVTQKPTDLGENICVGEHEASYFNEFRQIRIGLDHVTTPYVLTAEADMLCPAEYYGFRPRRLGVCYRYANVWVNYWGKERFHFKGRSNGVQAVDCELWKRVIDTALQGEPEWDGRLQCNAQPRAAYFWSGEPVITFKTQHNVSPRTWVSKEVTPVMALPYWGTIQDIKERFDAQDG